MQKALIGIFLITSVVWGLAACSGAEEPARAPNVVLITIDCLRTDKVGVYGHAGGLTPHIDALARSGARFRTAWVSMATTFPSHATMLTGRYPHYHGVRWNGHTLSEEVPTIAERLGAQDRYESAAFVAYRAMLFRGGLGRGFGTVSDAAAPASDEERVRPGEEVVTLAKEWLENRSQAQPFFLWAHLFEPHVPYTPTEYSQTRLQDYDGIFAGGVSHELVMTKRREYLESPADLAALEVLYEGEVQRADRYVGRIIDTLKERGLLENTVVIVTGDHGEAIGEHGRIGHGPVLWESILRVPLVVADFRNPASRVVEEPVGLVDLAATIASLSGVEPPAGNQGRDLTPALAGMPLSQHTYFAEVRFVPDASDNWYDPEALAVWSWPMKLVRNRGDSILYDLEQDPAGVTPLNNGNHATIFEYLKSEADDFRAGDLTAAASNLSARDIEELRSLGYIQ